MHLALLGNLTATQVGGQEDHVWDKSTFRLSPRVSVALSSIPGAMPERIAGFFDLVEQQKTQLQVVTVFAASVLGDQRMGFAMAQIPWRRADQLGNLVGVLKLRQSILITARASPKRISAPLPPSESSPNRWARETKIPTGRPGEFNPARKT